MPSGIRQERNVGDVEKVATVSTAVSTPPRTEWGPTEATLLRCYCATGCSTPPAYVVAGEAMCWDCAEEMGALS